MKLTTLINSAHNIFVWINSMPKITSVHIAIENNSGASINAAVNSDSLSSYSTSINSLNSFDTAFIAYQMMGLSDSKSLHYSPVAGLAKS